MTWLDENGKRLRSLLMTALVLIATVFVGFTAYDLLAPAIVVNRIVVPKDLNDAGYTPEAVAQLVVDGIRRVYASANNAAGADVAAAGRAQDVKLPGMELTLRSLLGFVKSAIPSLQDAEISGEITMADWQRAAGAEPRILLRLRADRTGPDAKPSSAPARPIGELDLHVDAVVAPLLDEIRPIVRAAALYYKEPREADALIARAKRACTNGTEQGCLSAHHLAGLRAYQCMDYARALAEFEVVIRHMSRWSDAHWKAVVWKNKGNALRRLERFDEAIKAYKTAIDHDATLTTAYTNMGTAFGKWVEEKPDPLNGLLVLAAIGQLELAQRRNRRSADPDYRLGEIHMNHTGDTAKARQHFAAASQLLQSRRDRVNAGERDIETPVRLARAMRKLDGKAYVASPSAAADLAEHLKSHPERVDLTLDHADLLATFEQWPEAGLHYQAVMTKAPHYWVPLRNRASMEKAQGNTKVAQTLADEAKRLKAAYQHRDLPSLPKGDVKQQRLCYLPINDAAGGGQVAGN